MQWLAQKEEEGSVVKDTARARGQDGLACRPPDLLGSPGLDEQRASERGRERETESNCESSLLSRRPVPLPLGRIRQKPANFELVTEEAVVTTFGRTDGPRERGWARTLPPAAR